MERYLLVARSITHAQQMMKVLDRAGIRTRVLRASAELTGRGCGYTLEVGQSGITPPPSAACRTRRSSRSRSFGGRAMIYLDSAATTFQKPLSVSYAMQRAMRTMSSPGRGGYAAAEAAEETAFRCRSLAAELFGVPSPEQVVFTIQRDARPEHCHPFARAGGRARRRLRL